MKASWSIPSFSSQKSRQRVQQGADFGFADLMKAGCSIPSFAAKTFVTKCSKRLTSASRKLLSRLLIKLRQRVQQQALAQIFWVDSFMSSTKYFRDMMRQAVMSEDATGHHNNCKTRYEHRQRINHYTFDKPRY